MTQFSYQNFSMTYRHLINQVVEVNKEYELSLNKTKVMLISKLSPNRKFIHTQ